MSPLEDAELRKKLDDSERLRRRTEEFRAKEEFSRSQRVLLDQVHQRSAQLKKRVIEAAQHRTAWEFTKAELWRDYHALVNAILLFEQRLDSNARRNG